MDEDYCPPECDCPKCQRRRFRIYLVRKDIARKRHCITWGEKNMSDNAVIGKCTHSKNALGLCSKSICPRKQPVTKCSYLRTCFGEFRCWNQVQAICPVATRCKQIAKERYGVTRKNDRKRKGLIVWGEEICVKF